MISCGKRVNIRALIYSDITDKIRKAVELPLGWTRNQGGTVAASLMKSGDPRGHIGTLQPRSSNAARGRSGRARGGRMTKGQALYLGMTRRTRSRAGRFTRVGSRMLLSKPFRKEGASHV